jgi:hypothetical protein
MMQTTSSLSELLENEPATKFCKLLILSHYVQDKEDKSVSGALIGIPETDKTRTLKKFYHLKGISVQTDLTYVGVINHVLPMVENGSIKTIIVPDFIKTIMKKQATMYNFIGILSSLIEEGVHEITLRDRRDFRGARANLITTMTPSLLEANKLMWNRMGFLSRLLPFTYNYNEEKKEAIRKAIEKQEIPEPKPIDLDIPEFKIHVQLSEDIAHELNPIVSRLIESERAIWYARDGTVGGLTDKGLGFRHQHQLQSLLKAHALSRGDTTVTEEDLEEIKRIGKWINYDYNLL